MKSNSERIGSHIRLVDVRDKDEAVKTLLGLSIDKKFIPSVANTIGTNLANYKIVRKGQFACSLMQVRRDKKMPVALLSDFDEAIISPAYPVFEIVDEDRLLPEYFMMWMRRPEFDREACFYAVGGVRGSLEWEDFCNMELPVPSLAKQREIVAEYQTVVDRIRLNERLNEKLEETAQAIYRHWFVDFDFPMTADQAEALGKPELEGQPYKSSGGELVYNETLDQEIPVGWKDWKLEEFSTVQNGYAFKSEDYQNTGCTMLRTTDISDNGFFDSEEPKFLPPQFLENPKYANFRFEKFDTVMVMVGASVGKMGMVSPRSIPALQNQNMWRFRPLDDSLSPLYLFLLVKAIVSEVLSEASGSAREFLTKGRFQQFNCVKPVEDIHEDFNERIAPVLRLKWVAFEQTVSLRALSHLLLASLAKQ